MRYRTVGDYWKDADGTLHIKVAESGDPRYAEAVAIHELFELLLCQNKGVTLESIDSFDEEFETHPENIDKEPGDEPNAPYRDEHNLATAVERMYIASLELSWKEYDDAQSKIIEQYGK